MGALYRRVRPLTFQEVVGQEHVKEPLQRAIREGLLAQAYLFSGPRGVGKTTTARLLAMGVGCAGEPKPCGVCEHCQMVREGRHPDVLEIDAASHNSVEDVRELQERLLLSPLLAPKKVFILDEAHMLSKSAFNALLKTLEEPPEHVLFIFATTEPERMPPTILSRTQHFRFRRLGEEEIAAKLRRILQGLGREAEEEALFLLARLADGAMRDAESLLDRLLLLEGPLTREKVEEAFGLPPKEALFQVARLLAARAGPGAPSGSELREALELARTLYQKGFASKSLISGLLEVLREELGEVAASRPRLGLSLLELIRGMEALDEVLVEMNRRPELLGLELALLKLHAAWAPPSEKPSSGPEGPSEAWAKQGEPQKAAVSPPFERGMPRGAAEPQVAASLEEDLLERWRGFLQSLKPTLQAILREGRPRLEGDRLLIVFFKGKEFHHRRALEKKADYAELALRTFGVRTVEPVLDPSLRGGPSASHKAEPREKKTLEPTPSRKPQEPAAPFEGPRPPALSTTQEGDGRGPRPGEDLEEPRLRYLMRLFGARLVHLKPSETGRTPSSSEEGGAEPLIAE